MFLHLLGNQVAFGDFVFFLAQIAAQVDDFHTVAQGGMDGCKVVGRGDEKDFREVVIQLDKVVVESIILLRVKDFQKRSLRVATDVVAAHLVDFIENKNWISRLHLAQILDDTAWHSTNVSFSVAAQFRFVAYTAK